MSDPRRRPQPAAARGAWAACLLGALVTGVLGGCQNELFADQEEPWRAPAQRLKEIGTFHPEAESTDTPISPDARLKELEASGLRLPRKEYPSRMDVTLADVRQKSLVNNLELKVAQVDPAIARARVSEEEAKFEAVFFADYTRNENNLLTDFEEGNPLVSDSGDAGIRFPLATGGEFTVNSESLRGDPTAAALTNSPLWENGVAFSISQPILRNAGVESNTASIRIAKLQGQAADARMKLEAIRVLANADRAYWSLYRAWRELEVRQQEYDLAVAQLQRARNRVAAGEAAEIEVIRAESGVGTTIEAIIVADNALRLRIRDLKRIMNDPSLPLDSPTALIPATPPNPLSLKLDSRKLAERAVQDRMEMLELELQLAVDANTIDLRRNQALPLFVIDYQYQVLGSANGFGSAWADIGDNDQYVLSARAEIPLGNEAAKSRISQAILARLQRLATRDLRRQSIRTEVFNAVDNLENAWQRILAARLETALAGRTYEAEKRQFDVGLRTSTDVLDAASRLADAQSREVIALSGWQIALVDVAFATGTLLGGSRVQWEEMLPPPRVDPDQPPARLPHGPPAALPVASGSRSAQPTPVPPPAEPGPGPASGPAPGGTAGPGGTGVPERAGS
ncbi:MAG: TolC family protein [Phycisphaerales bacterium]